MLQPAFFDKERRTHAIDDKHDVVAYEDCGYEEVGIGIEASENAAEHSSLLHVEFDSDTVGGDVGYLGAGEECREHQ